MYEEKNQRQRLRDFHKRQEPGEAKYPKYGPNQNEAAKAASDLKRITHYFEQLPADLYAEQAELIREVDELSMETVRLRDLLERTSKSLANMIAVKESCRESLAIEKRSSRRLAGCLNDRARDASSLELKLDAIHARPVLLIAYDRLIAFARKVTLL